MARPSDRTAEASRAGVLFGLGAYCIWGCLPVFLALMNSVPPLQVVMQRVIWSCALLAVVVTVLGRWRVIGALLARPRTALALICTAALISANWLLFIFAVQHGQVLSASIAYFVNPLMNIALGVLILRERLNAPQIAAVALATLGVVVLATAGSATLWLPLSIAITFALYGFIRKLTPADALGGLMVETALLTPLSLLWLGWCAAHGTLSLGDAAPVKYYLLISGAVTAAPLLLFAAAAKRLRFSTLGFLQYVAPSLQFLEAVLLFGEKLTPVHIVTFGCIWGGLAIYAMDSIRTNRAEAVMTPE